MARPSPAAAAAVLLIVTFICLPTLAKAQSPSPSDSTPAGPVALTPSTGAAAVPLEGTPWRLVSYLDGDEQRLTEPALASWLTLRGGALSGDTGCASLRGHYGAMGGAIRFDLLNARRATQGCGDRATALDKAFREALRRTASFELITAEDRLAQELVLRDRDGADLLRLALDDVGGLETEEWQLESYTVDGRVEAAATSLPAVLAFSDDDGQGAERRRVGAITGSSGCNGIVGTYARRARMLELADLEVTEAACPADLAAQEDAILAVLRAPTLTLELVPDRLILTAPGSGESLELVASTPLEGSTWLLGSIPGKPRPRTPVTLRMEAGVVSGEGPCGPYTGTYETDGLFVAFRSLRGTTEGDCPRQDRQRELFSALERAVLLERDQPTLGLLDALGQPVARFKRPGAR